MNYKNIKLDVNILDVDVNDTLAVEEYLKYDCNLKVSIEMVCNSDLLDKIIKLLEVETKVKINI